jgi:DnaD/phage-associated family protein
MAFAGFSPRVRFTPVPDPLFGPLLEQIGDLSELKATLRIIWLLHQKKGYPRYVTHGELLADRVLARGLSVEGREPGPELERALKMAVRRGTLVTGAEDGRERLYALNTERDRRAIGQGAHAPRTTDAEPATSEEERRNIFVLYEDSIGMLNPMIAETLKEAEQSYPEPWFEDAFREAVENNKRSWRYVAAILDRWEREGKSDGGPGRYSKEAGYQKHFRR